MMQSVRNLLGLVGLACVTLWEAPAAASEVFPGALQEAADMQCVPLCTMCHTSNPGTATTWPFKLLPKALNTQTKMVNGTPVRILKQGNADSLKEAYAAYAKTASAAELADIKAGREPETHADVCGPTYGCGAHVARQAAAPRDFTGALWVVGAVVAGGLLRRRRRPNAA
jgi:MYXO-CTERM domain-containing protein